MNFSIFDGGNLVASYEDEQAAIEALTQLASDDPESAEDMVLVTFDDLGEVVGDPLPGSSVRSSQAA
jgi:hypothetical protein